MLRLVRNDALGRDDGPPKASEDPHNPGGPAAVLEPLEDDLPSGPMAW